MSRLANAEAEYALVVRLVLEPELIPEAISHLHSGDFSESKHSKVFQAISDRYNASKPIDTVTIAADTGIKLDVLGLPIGASAPIDAYIQAIRDSAKRRSLVDALDLARHQVEESSDEPLAIVEAAIEKILKHKGADSLIDPEMAAKSYHEIARRRLTEPVGLSYGLEKLDSIMLPAKPGRVIMVASRPSVGKTAMAENIADHWAKSGPVLFVSLEMEVEELQDRAIARDTGISAEDIGRGLVDYDDLTTAIDRRKNVPIFYLDEPSASVAQVKGAAARLRLTHGELAGIIIDYVQLLADAGDEEVYRIGNISHLIKRLARAMHCPVLALAQFSRRIEQSETPRAPRLSDLRDSGVLEQDADAVLALVGQVGTGPRELHVLKQRAGRGGLARLWFDGDHAKFLSEKPDPEDGLNW